MSSPSPICICGAPLIMKHAKECYIDGSNIECDGCGSLVTELISVYHCMDHQNKVHPFGFDLCASCGNTLKSTHLISTQLDSDFLVVEDKLHSNILKRAATPFEWQKLCYWVNGSARKSIQHIEDTSKFNCISDYMLSKAVVKKAYIQFNHKLNQSNDCEPNSNSKYQGNINHGHQSYIASFPALIAERKINTFQYHHEFKKAMNEYQNMDKDIWNMRQSRDIWNVVGLIDCVKHLSTLDHSLHDELNHSVYVDSDILNYHHWIPSVFQVNDDLTECKLLSQIPNLDPHKYSKTLYPLIECLFLYQVPQLENVTNSNLRNGPLRVIVKAQDYQLHNCDINDAYVSNMHKEGLYENISAVALYYYHIDEDINGGELEIASVIGVKDSRAYYGVTELKNTAIRVQEATSLVFSNELCYHRVNKLYGDGSRKIFAFFLIAPDMNVNIPIDARFVVVNWKYHAQYMLDQWLKEHNDHSGYQWIVNIVCEYVVGSRKYIQEAIELYKRCRTAYHHEITYHEGQITSTGKPRYIRKRKPTCSSD